MAVCTMVAWCVCMCVCVCGVVCGCVAVEANYSGVCVDPTSFLSLLSFLFVFLRYKRILKRREQRAKLEQQRRVPKRKVRVWATRARGRERRVRGVDIRGLWSANSGCVGCRVSDATLVA